MEKLRPEGKGKGKYSVSPGDLYGQNEGILSDHPTEVWKVKYQVDKLQQSV